MSIASLYPSINPSLLLDFANSKVLDSRVTFTRTTTATYYDGVTTAKAEENLLTYSQEFDNAAWSKTNTTVTANATTAPDGTSTAEALFETAVTNEFRVNQSCSATSGLNYTISVYVKANGRNYVALYDAQNSQGKYFDVTAGGGGSVQGNFVGAPVSASISYVGSDWYRCSMTVSNTSSSIAVRIYIANTATNVNYAGDVTKGLYLWGAQVEQRSSATAYTATTTQAITNYIPVLQTAAAGQARFDHNPTTGESLGLLIEEARTNVMTYSEDFSAWSLGATTVTSNTVVSPNGSINGDLIASTGTTDSHDVYLAQTTGATAITASVYVKNRSGQYIYVALSNPANGTDYSTVSFDITNGTYGTVNTAGNFTGGSASITSVGNSWYRVSITATSNVSSNYVFIGISSGLNPSYSPRGRVQTTNTNSFFAWGAQLEAGSFATSYIPTVASSATRNADAASMTGTNFSSWFNNGEGTLFVNFKTSVATGFPQAAVMSDGSSNNAIGVDAQSGLRSYVTTLGVAVASFSASKSGSGDLVTLAYKVNDFGSSFNGAAAGTDTSGNVPVVSQFGIGQSYSSSNLLNGTIKKISYYPIKATSTQLQALTV